MTNQTTNQLAEALAQDATTQRFQPSRLDVLDWVWQNDLRFAAFLPLKQNDPRISRLKQMLTPIGDRR
jgi:hypothetical protein